MALMGKWNQCANGVKDFCYHAVGCVRVMLCNIAAYVVKVPRRLPGGARDRSCLAVALGFGFRFQTGKGFFSVNGLHPPAFQVVIAAVERLPNLEHFFKISRHGVLNEVVRSASALRGEVFEFLFGLGGQVYFHAFEDIGKPAFGQRVLNSLGDVFLASICLVAAVIGFGDKRIREHQDRVITERLNEAK